MFKRASGREWDTSGRLTLWKFSVSVSLVAEAGLFSTLSSGRVLVCRAALNRERGMNELRGEYLDDIQRLLLNCGFVEVRHALKIAIHK